MLVWQNFTNTKNPSTILGNTFSKAQMLIWHPFYKAQMLFWHPFYKAQNAILANISKIFLKAQYYFGNYLQKFYKYKKAQVLSLAILYQKPKYQFGKILQILKAQVLPLAIFYQKPKHQFGKIFTNTQSPSTILGNILENFYKSPILSWQHLINNPKLLLFLTK